MHTYAHLKLKERCIALTLSQIVYPNARAAFGWTLPCLWARSLRQRAIGTTYRTLSQASCFVTVNILNLERWNSCPMSYSTHTKPGCSKRVPIQPEQGLSQEQKARRLSLSETMWVAARNCPWVMNTPQKETVRQDGFVPKLYQGTPAPNVDGLVQERRDSNTLAMGLRLSCTNPSTSYGVLKQRREQREPLRRWTYWTIRMSFVLVIANSAGACNYLSMPSLPRQCIFGSGINGMDKQFQAHKPWDVCSHTYHTSNGGLAKPLLNQWCGLNVDQYHLKLESREISFVYNIHSVVQSIWNCAQSTPIALVTYKLSHMQTFLSDVCNIHCCMMVQA